MTNILETLYKAFDANSDKIEKFFKDEFLKSPALIYNSCDLRHSGFKICPIDTNCFPAGFNNLGEESKKFAKEIANKFFADNFGSAKKIIIIPENHTRNLRYLANVLDLAEILSDSKKVVIGTLLTDIEDKTILEVDEHKKIELVKLRKINGRIQTIDGFEADLIVLNNDLTDGIPEILQNLETPINPSINLGWFKRTKSDHFDIYNDLATKLSAQINIDPWLISTIHTSCAEVNFKSQEGFDRLAVKVDETIALIKEKYYQFGIEDEPYVYVKADNGTYGMAIWQVSSGQEVLNINKKNRNKMNMIKGSIQNTKVLIQEGVKTIDRINGHFAEPMTYLINSIVIGNLFRVNESRDEKSSLNAPGASFYDLRNLNNDKITLGISKEKVSLIYSVIAKLAALSTSVENQKIIK